MFSIRISHKALATLLVAAFFGISPHNLSAQVLYVGENSVSPTYVYDASIVTVSPSGAVAPFVNFGAGSYGYGIAFDNGGNLFAIADPTLHYTIDKITADGKTSVFFNGGNTYAPVELAFAPNGNLFVSVYRFLSPSPILKIAPDGSYSTLATINGQTEGITTDSEGNVYVSTGGGVDKVTPDGVISNFATGTGVSFGLTFDLSGNLFVADQSNGEIFKVTPDGTTSTFVSGLNRPGHIAFNAQGNLFVATLNGIDEISPQGSVTLFNSSLNNVSGLAFEVVPEPSCWRLLMVGLLATVGFARFRRS